MTFGVCETAKIYSPVHGYLIQYSLNFSLDQKYFRHWIYSKWPLTLRKMDFSIESLISRNVNYSEKIRKIKLQKKVFLNNFSAICITNVNLGVHFRTFLIIYLNVFWIFVQFSKELPSMIVLKIRWNGVALCKCHSKNELVYVIFASTVIVSKFSNIGIFWLF